MRGLSQIYVIIGCLFVASLIISNISAGKIVSFCGLNFTAAILLFPLTYVFSDILTEVYGFKGSRLIIWMGFFCNFLMISFFSLVVKLPHPDFFKDQAAYEIVLGMTPRLVLASMVAYFVGEFVNSVSLSAMKKITGGRYLWIRTIGSTMTGQFIDTFLFMIIAFLNIIPFEAILGMIFVEYVIKVTYEIFATPITYKIVNLIKRSEGIDIFDYGVRYNPFGLKIWD